MKKIILLCLVVMIILVFDSPIFAGNNDYGNGYQDGYQEGYTYGEANAMKPMAPMTPMRTIYEDDTYQDGYNRGLIDGYNKRQQERQQSNQPLIILR